MELKITPVRDGVIMPVNSTSRVIGVTDSNLGTIYDGAMFIYDVLNNYLDTGNPAPFKLNNYAAVIKHYNTIFAIRHLVDGGIDKRLSQPSFGFTSLRKSDKHLFT